MAALIAALVAVAGWLINAHIIRGHEHRRRKEKERDYQIALRAEIWPEWRLNKDFDAAAHLAEIRTRYRMDDAYSVTVPIPPSMVVFEAIKTDIHLLPEDVIEPVVMFARQKAAVVAFAEDLRGDRFRSLPRERQMEMYADYIALLNKQTYVARQALDALAPS